MQHLKQDEYPFDPSLEDGRTPSETASADEFASLPDETVFTAPEDSAAEEFVSGVRSKEEDGEKTSPLLLQKLAFFFVTAVIAALSILFAASGIDPLGNDFLNSGSAAVIPSSPSSPSSPSVPSSPSTVKKTSVTLPTLNGKVTYNYHVTYAPDGDTYSGTEYTEKDMYSSARSWIVSKGGDPDSLVLYDYDLTATGKETSDDFVMVGDMDDLENAYIISGTIVETYILEVWYEGYAKGTSAPVTEKYDDAFPVLPNPDPDFDGNYAWSLISPSPGYKGGTEEYLIVDSVYLVAGTVYTDAGTSIGKVSGASYDMATNTLTLTNFHGSRIEGNLMGNGFKIKLIGDSSIDELMMWGAMYGCSVTFTGNGSIKINENNKASTGVGIYFECEDSMSCLMIDREATVEVFGDYAIVIHRTLMDKAIYALKPIKMTGGEYSIGEFVEYTVTETLPDGTTRETVRTVADISKDVGLDLYDYSIIGPDGKPSKHVLFAPGK